MPDLELGCKWYFAPEPEMGAEAKGPNRSMMLTFRQSPYGSLVRESIQNSLDAAPKDATEPVKVVYSNGFLRQEDYPELFNISKRIEGIKTYFPTNEQTRSIVDQILAKVRSYNGRMPFVKVSDFNTVGMSYTSGSTNTPFYAFLHAEGLHVNDNPNSGGAFGAGKDAYFAMSDISSVMCYTYTQSKEHYFQCTSRLCSHKVDDQNYMSKGYYDNNSTEPVSDITKIPACPFFRKDADGTGTDIMILGMRLDEVRARKEIVKSVLQNFWMAVYDRKLEVVVNGNAQIPNITINKSNLKRLMREIFEGMVDRSTENNPDNYNPRPYFEVYSTINEVNDYDTEKYSYYESKDGEYPTLGKMSLYLLKDPKATDKITYMRSPKMKVYAERTKNFRCGIYGLFLCTNSQGDEVLRDLEDQAHKGWRPSNARIYDNDTAVNAIKELNDFVDSCLKSEFHSDDEDETEIQKLSNFLSIAEDLLDQKKKESYSGEKGEGAKEDGITRISKITNDGFVEDKLPEEDEKANLIDTFDTVGKPDPKGELGGNPHGDGTSGGGERGPGDEPVKEDPTGIKGTYKKNVGVEYSQLVDKIDGEVFNTLLINSDQEASNLRMELQVVGESGQYRIAISKVLGQPKAVCNGNVISGIELKKGVNTIQVKFNDNMIHSIKLGVYNEIK